MVRLVFRPYTQVWRTICTSVPLRASTRVSPGFTLLKHSSPSFGSYQICSCSYPSQKIRDGRCCCLRLAPYSYFHFAYEFSTRKLAYVIDSLVRVSRRVGKSHFGKINYFPQARDLFAYSYSSPQTSSCLLFEWADSNGRFGNFPPRCPRTLFSFSLLAFIASFSTVSSLLTLFSKFFSSFLHSTCSLSVSRPYLALEEVYLPIWASIPRSSTLRKFASQISFRQVRGFHPLCHCFSTDLYDRISFCILL